MQIFSSVEKRNRWFKKAAIAILAFFAFVLLLDKVLMPLYVKRGEVSIVPKVLGKPVDAGMKALSDAGFDPIKYEVQYDEKAKEGTILRQTPEGGEESKPGRKVFLIVSSGKEIVSVPDMVGKSLKDARIMLVKANLDAGKIDLVFTDSTPSGIVFKQYPAPGTNISAEKSVNLSVSQGPRTGRVPVPDVVGMRLEEAEFKIGNANLRVGEKNFQDRSVIEGEKSPKPNTVYDTYPAAGELIEVGSTVNLFIVKEVSKEPAPNEGGP
jgi:serine/threonine-protein kinase